MSSFSQVCKQSKEPAYEDKMKAIKRKLPETKQELESGSFIFPHLFIKIIVETK